MDIKELYETLSSKNLTSDDLLLIVDAKNQCKIDNNTEYSYLFDLLIIDKYLDDNLCEEALDIAINDLKSLDGAIYRNIYVSFLDRIIYLCINKKNYRSAYRYALRKKDFLDLNDNISINRWYLEMAYIYGELGQKDKSLLNLKAIIANVPDESTKSLALSNLTKLYLDQGMISEAKSTLNECMRVTMSINDQEGIVYCDYLNAKLLVLEGKYKFAKSVFKDMFKSLKILNDNYLSIGNEYVSLLIENDDYSEALLFYQRYLIDYEGCQDIYIKKDYLKNQLNLNIHTNKSISNQAVFELKSYINKINQLEEEIALENANTLVDALEDDKSYEIMGTLKNTLDSLEKTIIMTSRALENETERGMLMDLSKVIEKEVGAEEIVYAIFNRNEFSVLPELFLKNNEIETYNYKKNRLYERTFDYSMLLNTIFELLLSNNEELVIDFTDTTIEVKDLITQKSYLDLGIKYLVAIPLFYNKEIFSAMVFTSVVTNITDNEKLMDLKLAAKSIEQKFISLFLKDALESQKSITDVATLGLDSTMFYYHPETEKIVLSNAVMMALSLTTKYITRKGFEKMVSFDDFERYQLLRPCVRAGEKYCVNYHLESNDRKIYVEEKASPYINKDGITKFYVGTMSILDDSLSQFNYLKEKDFHQKIDEIKEKAKSDQLAFSIYRVSIENLDSYEVSQKNQLIEIAYDLLSSQIIGFPYIMNNESIYLLVEYNDAKTVDKTAKKILSLFDKNVKLDSSNTYLKTNILSVRYPVNSPKIDDLISFLELKDFQNERYVSFNDEKYKTYLRQKTIVDLIDSALKNNDYDCLFTEMKLNDSFYLTYNIKGINYKDDFISELPINKLLEFEEASFMKFLDFVKIRLNSDVFIEMSSFTLIKLVNSGFFDEKNDEIYKHLIIVLSSFSSGCDECISCIQDVNIRVGIKSSVFNNITFKLADKMNLYGIIVDEEINDTIKNFLSLQNYEIIEKKDVLTEHIYKSI